MSGRPRGQVGGSSCVVWVGQKPDLSLMLSACVAQRLEKERRIITCKRSCGYFRAQGGKQQL